MKAVYSLKKSTISTLTVLCRVLALSYGNHHTNLRMGGAMCENIVPQRIKTQFEFQRLDRKTTQHVKHKHTI